MALQMPRIQELGLEINPNNAASNFRILNEGHMRLDGGMCIVVITH